MKITWTAGSVLASAGIIILAIFGVWIFFNRDRIIGGVKQAASLVNPVDSQNIANRAVTSITSAATGREETFGGFLHDIFGGTNQQIQDMLKGAPPLKNPLPGYDRSGGPAYG